MELSDDDNPIFFIEKSKTRRIIDEGFIECN